jgi:SWI/SNF-related matrix-associated actin-dependent regulator 1 of chromatin subfamily A
VKEQLKLMPFQKVGLRWIKENGGSGLLADEMGLGKTIQAIAYLRSSASTKPALIICPAVVKENWRREIKRFTKLRIKTLRGRKPRRLNLSARDIFLINYEIVDAWKEELSRIQYVILDESHYIKNKSAIRTKAIMGLCKGKKTLCLTGTPIANGPVDLYTSIRLANPKLFSSFWKFAIKYCDAQLVNQRWVLTGASNTKELHHILTNTKTMLRRRKVKVLKQLPKKTRSVVVLPLSNPKAYETSLHLVHNWLQTVSANKFDITAGLNRLEELAQSAVAQKMKAMVEWISNAKEESEKMIIFARHLYALDMLEEAFKDSCLRIDGSTKDKQSVVDKFTNDKTKKILLGQIRAAGTGVNIQVASVVVFAEIGATSIEHDQAESRAHRHGQQKPVICYYLVGKGTVEELMVKKLIDDKRSKIDAVIDNRDPNYAKLLTTLLNKSLAKFKTRQQV